MAEFTTKNRTPLNIIILIVWLLITAIDNWIEKDTSTPIQWIAFILMFLAIIYVNFISVVDEVELEEEHYVPSLQDKQVSELINDEPEWRDDFNNKMNELYKEDSKKEDSFEKINNDITDFREKNKDWISNGDGTKTKTVFVVQPIHVTQEEFNEKIQNNQIDMETKDNNKELPKALANPEIVIGYSLHNVHKKFRPMYNDICEFAINGSPKTEAEITAKLKPYGHPFTTERSNTNTLAFNLDSSPKIRIPESGYFGIK